MEKNKQINKSSLKKGKQKGTTRTLLKSTTAYFIQFCKLYFFCLIAVENTNQMNLVEV